MIFSADWIYTVQMGLASNRELRATAAWPQAPIGSKTANGLGSRQEVGDVAAQPQTKLGTGTGSRNRFPAAIASSPSPAAPLSVSSVVLPAHPCPMPVLLCCLRTPLRPLRYRYTSPSSLAEAVRLSQVVTHECLTHCSSRIRYSKLNCNF